MPRPRSPSRSGSLQPASSSSAAAPAGSCGGVSIAGPSPGPPGQMTPPDSAREPLARRHQRRAIELADQRAAHARVVERRPAHVERQVAHGRRTQAQRRQPGGGGHPALLGVMLADERRDDVDLAAARRAQRRRRVRLVAEHDVRHRRRRAPVAGEALQLDGAVAPRAHPIRAGADDLGLGAGRRTAARRRHDRHLGQGAQRVRAGPGQAHAHRARPGSVDAGHVGQLDGALARPAGSVDRPHDVGRRQRPPVVKAHVRLQLDARARGRRSTRASCGPGAARSRPAAPRSRRRDSAPATRTPCPATMRMVHTVGAARGSSVRASPSSHTVRVSAAAAIARSRARSPAIAGATAAPLAAGSPACRHGLDRAGGPSHAPAPSARAVRTRAIRFPLFL